MERKASANEFEAVIDSEGKIAVPNHLAVQFGGKRLQVRLISTEISGALKDRSVTEEEVERIAAMQLESRDQVIAFLLSEGSLRNNRGFRRRSDRACSPQKVQRR